MIGKNVKDKIYLKIVNDEYRGIIYVRISKIIIFAKRLLFFVFIIGNFSFFEVHEKRITHNKRMPNSFMIQRKT